MTSSDLRARARQSLKNNYFYAFLSCLVAGMMTTVGPVSTYISAIARVVSAIVGNGSPAFGLGLGLGAGSFSSLLSVVALIIGGAVEVGLARYFLNLINRENAAVEDVFSNFKYVGNTFAAYILTHLIVFAWSLLFIVPGILASLSYAMTPYILAEHPEIGAREAMALSKSMMKGNRGRLFCLNYSFIGWILLCGLTGGIGAFFLAPYMEASRAEFFNEVSGNNYRRAMEYDILQNERSVKD